MKQIKISFVDKEETLEEQLIRQKRRNKYLILFILLLILGFIVYEVKFDEKSIFNNGDKYEEYDPNYPIDSNKSNIEQSEKKETSNVVEEITSNILITSNTLDNKSNSNINSNSNSQSNGNIKSNTTSNTKDTTKPSVSNITTKVDNNNITIISISASDNITNFDKLKKEYSIDNKKWQTSNTFGSLTPNHQYTIYVRVTDEAGNISSTYVKNVTTTYTPVPSNVSGTYVNGSEYIYVYGSTNYIIISYKNGYKYLDIKSTNNVSKLYGDESLSVTVYGDRLTIGNVTYTKKETTNQSKAVSDMFVRMYGGTYVDSSTTICNGLVVINSIYNHYFVTSKNGNKTTCHGYIPVKRISRESSEYSWGTGYVNTEDFDIKGVRSDNLNWEFYVYKMQAKYFIVTQNTRTGNGDEFEITRKLTIEDAVKLKAKGTL